MFFLLKYLRYGPCKFKLALAAEGHMFFDKLYAKYHDYLDLIRFDKKVTQKRVSKYGIEKFEKTSTFLRNFFISSIRKLSIYQ